MVQEKDYLTGLHSRQGLYHFCATIEYNTLISFMFLDIDNFKSVNDIYGHNTGDELLKRMAVLLEENVPNGYIVRLGGDEFCIVFVPASKREQLEQIATFLIKSMNTKIIEHLTTNISISIGILTGERYQNNLDVILNKSDHAMYHAKSKGKGCFVFFNEIEELISWEEKIQREQKDAIEEAAINISFRPIINLQTSSLYSTGIITRWMWNDGELLDEDKYYKVFEKNGYISCFDDWLIEEVCKCLKQYHKEHKRAGRVSFKISKISILQGKLIEYLNCMLKCYEIDQNEIELEIEERHFKNNSEILVTYIQQLIKDGYAVSIIEVGVDFSSLRYWDQLTLSSIKFNEEYIQKVLSNSKGKQILKTLINMSRDLQIDIIACGIKSKEQLKFLNYCSCNAAEGSVYSKALSSTQYYNYIKDIIQDKEVKIKFSFKGNIISDGNLYEGKMNTKQLEFCNGIHCDEGGIHFSGGAIKENIIELPASIISTESFTISFWVKPAVHNSWTSIIYLRFRNGFLSLVPQIDGGYSVFRCTEFLDVRGFHDILSRQIPRDKWTFITASYDAKGCCMRYYINGEKAGILEEIPSLRMCTSIMVGGDPYQETFVGEVSALTFYNILKSEKEVSEIYMEYCMHNGFIGEMQDRI